MSYPCLVNSLLFNQPQIEITSNKSTSGYRQSSEIGQSAVARSFV